MARVTVEDCLKVIPRGDRFELSVLASHRAKEISKGASIKAGKENDKNTVIALKEVAGHYQDVDKLRDLYILSLQKNAKADDVLEEETTNISEISSVVGMEYAEGPVSENIVAEEALEDDFISVEDYSLDDEVDSDD